MTTVAWLIPDLIDGSGGHRTIIQNAHFLQESGYKTKIYLERNPCSGIGETPAEAVRRRFGYDMRDVSVGWTQLAPCDVLVATVWHSARIVKNSTLQCHKAYFVQDMESLFAPAGYYQLIAENSYKYGLVPITIGNWLKHELLDRYGSTSFSFDFCAELKTYRRLPAIERERAICFIHQPEKPRRAATLGLEALAIVKNRNPEIKIYTYGSSAKTGAVFQHEDLGLLNLDQCNALYNRCALGLCLSATNPSRVPFEMMAAGLPVVELHRHNTIYDLPDSASLLCEQSPEALAEGILALMSEPDRRARMSRAGEKFMQGRDIPRGLEQFERAIDWISKSSIGDMPPKDIGVPIYRHPALTAGEHVAGVTQGPFTRTRGPVRKWASKHFGAHSRMGKFTSNIFPKGPSRK